MKPWIESASVFTATTCQQALSKVHVSDGLLELEDQFQDVFSETPGQTHVVRYDIKMTPGTIICTQPYRVSEAHCRAIYCMPQNNIIEKSYSPWSSLIMIEPMQPEPLQ